MEKRKLYGTSNLVREKVSTLKKTGMTPDGWGILYMDEVTGESWLEYIVDERSFVKNLMRCYPPLSTGDLIHIALASHREDEVVAAANRLVIEEKDEQKGFRETLLNRLEAIVTGRPQDRDKARIAQIINYAQLTDVVNRREILGKSAELIDRDAAYFRAAAKRAQEILNKVK